LTNKDLSFVHTSSKGKRSSRGNNDIFTDYLIEAITNQNQESIDICGNGEITFRRKSLFYSEEKLKKGFHEELKLTEKYGFPIIKDKRFTKDAFEMKLPLMINFKEKKSLIKDFNQKFQDHIRNNDVNVLSIDRGERNLIYVNVLDPNGNILLQEDLNVIYSVSPNGDVFEKDFNKLLDEKQKEMRDSKKKWDYQNKIKDIKEDYCGKAVKRVIDLVREYNAVIVLEDLNSGFKDLRRSKVEKSIYTLFETKLINKLQCLSFKDIDLYEPGGHLNPIQLASANIKDSKQNGIIFFIEPWKTSKIDPSTGFTNEFKKGVLKNDVETVEKFDSITFTGDSYEFSFDYNNFTEKKASYKTDWTSFTGRRWKWDRSSKSYKQIDITTELTNHLNSVNIFVEPGMDVKQEIIDKDIKSISFYKTLFYLFNKSLDIRHTNSKDDYILSPVQKDGEFFDSRKANSNMPKDSDSNGSYHIGLKGIMCLESIKNSEGFVNVRSIDKNEWLTYVTENKSLELA
jgi:CRISPR-associated protein Cpf1